ncbi:hypothetical protein C369_00392 [Cryptococcus neoformans A5-35-17]|nr:hypothetical protein C369_00392 [Cryptococcus neoformans var. grubii A5-35-17]
MLPVLWVQSSISNPARTPASGPYAPSSACSMLSQQRCWEGGKHARPKLQEMSVEPLG